MSDQAAEHKRCPHYAYRDGCDCRHCSGICFCFDPPQTAHEAALAALIPAEERHDFDAGVARLVEQNRRRG